MAKSRTIRALLVFKKFKDDVLVTFALHVFKLLTGNKLLPSTEEYLPDLQTLQKVYSDAYDLAQSGNRKDIAAKDTAREALLENLELVTRAVNMDAIDNKEALLTSGLPITADASEAKKAATELPVITYTYGVSGTITLTLKNAIRVGSIIYQVALEGSVNELDGGPNWVTCCGGKNQCTFTDLPVGKRVLIRVGVWSATSPIIYTDTVTRMVA